MRVRGSVPYTPENIFSASLATSLSHTYTHAIVPNTLPHTRAPTAAVGLNGFNVATSGQWPLWLVTSVARGPDLVRRPRVVLCASQIVDFGRNPPFTSPQVRDKCQIRLAGCGKKLRCGVIGLPWMGGVRNNLFANSVARVTPLQDRQQCPLPTLLSNFPPPQHNDHDFIDSNSIRDTRAI